MADETQEVVEETTTTEEVVEETTTTSDPTDWRATLQSDDAKKFAETSPDAEHLVGRALTMQQKLSTAIVRPGKDAQPEEVAAYRRQIGMPESPEGYVFAMPEGQEPTEADLAFQTTMAEALHKAEVSTENVTLLTAAWSDFAQQTLEAQVASDKQFADKAETELRKAWGEEYDENKTHAERAATFMFGDQYEEVRHMETKDGRFVLDHPVMLKAMAATGREMAEGGLVPPMSTDARDQAQDKVSDLRARGAKALSEGNSREANRLYVEEQKELAKMGDAPIVGSGARAA